MALRQLKYQLLVCQTQHLKPRERKQLGRLTRIDGELRRIFSEFLLKEKNGEVLKRHRFILAKNKKGKVFGWALLRDVGHRCELMLYVQRSFRRNGIGTALVKKAEVLHRKWTKPKPIRVFRHDDQGDFYPRLGYQCHLC